MNQSQARGSFAALSQPDMMSKYGIRSASAQDPRYSNGNYVKPYSNWRGPIWVNTNLMIACEGEPPPPRPPCTHSLGLLVGSLVLTNLIAREEHQPTPRDPLGLDPPPSCARSF